MGFRSILSEGDGPLTSGPAAPPDYFHDLRLDQVVDAITAGKEEYDLKVFFYNRMPTVAAVQYRQEVMKDLEAGPALTCINQFASRFRMMRQNSALIEKSYSKQQKERWFLHAAERYCEAVRDLQESLSQLSPSSRGLLAFREYLSGYVASDRFVSLSETTRKLAADLASIEYAVLIRGGGFAVRGYSGEQDYSAEIASVFRKFRQGAVKDYRVGIRNSVHMNSVEEKILEFIALLNPEVFRRLEQFCRQNADYADPVLLTFDREVQFYVAYLEYVQGLRRAGLAFCFPEVSENEKDIISENGFDVALATKLIAAGKKVVPNSFKLTGKERVLVISGPNQGGKTTFARAFGQLHHFASIGCSVPGSSARLLLFNSLFTHFEQEENASNLHGKLEQDLLRIHDILEAAAPQSIVILNELFSSTTLRDAVFLSRAIMDRIIQLDLLCVSVTFLEELASLSEQTVSMVSTVVPENPAQRTFRIVRRPADGRSYAISVAEKYRLTYDCLSARMAF